MLIKNVKKNYDGKLPGCHMTMVMIYRQKRVNDNKIISSGFKAAKGGY